MISSEELILKSPYILREMFINLYGYYLSRKRFNKRFYKLLDELMLNLQKTPDQIKTEQFEMLKNTLIKAYQNVPYYTEIFDQTGFNPFKFDNEKDLTKLPFLDKAIVRKNFSNLQNPNFPTNKLKLHTTSGSTGEKLKFYQPKDLTYTINAAFMYRFYALFDIHPKDSRVTIGGRRFTKNPPYWSYNRSENQLLLSSHHLNFKTGVDYIKKINEYKPVFIQGHPNSILYLANLIINGQAKSSIHVKAIFTTGETLIEENRRIIELAFNTGVFQQYGSGESCFSAQETPEKVGYMLNYEHGYVEMIGDGKYKEIIATSFQNEAMPFIRYRVGDLVHPISVEKQKMYPFPYLFDEVLGRTDDILLSVKNEQILPVAIRMIVKTFLSDNTNYQLIQKSINDFELNLIDVDKKIAIKDLVKQLKLVFGSNAHIQIQYVESLLTEGGKIRNVINKIGK